MPHRGQLIASKAMLIPAGNPGFQGGQPQARGQPGRGHPDAALRRARLGSRARHEPCFEGPRWKAQRTQA
eukprot:15417150-Alexandrium_andersonii.AAC.1